MKTLILFILCAGFGLIAYGQDSRFGMGMEYSPNFANATSPEFPFNRGSDGFRLTQNCLIKAQYRLINNLHATIGIGYMDTREFVTIDIPDGFQDLYKVESNIFHHYVLVPVGLKYYMGSMYIHPEMAIGWNTANTSLDTYYTGSPTAGSISSPERHKDPHNINNVNTMTFPAFLTIGHEIPLKAFTLSLGIKSYYSFNAIGSQYINSRHAYGFGMVVGVRM